MDNKLSELSKPVMYVVRTLDGSVASVKNYKYTAPKGFTSEPLYSQEYVSALLADNEAKDKCIAELERERDNWQAATLAMRDSWREERAELEAKLATPVRLSKTTHPRCRQQHASDIRAAGFTVEGDE